METTQLNRVRYSPITSQAIGERAAQQRLARNAAIEYTLAHPNVSKNQLQRQLTLWRNQDPDKWQGSVAVQRPGLFKGRNSARQFHAADAKVLRECQREIRFAQQDPEKRAKTKPPRHGNNPQRDTNHKRLFRSRKDPITLVIEDNSRIRQLSSRRIVVDGLELQLAKSIPAGSRIVTVHIRERDSSIKQSRNRPLEQRSYEINLVLSAPDPEPKNILGKTVGQDVGVAHTLTDSDGNHHDRPQDQLQTVQDEINARLARQQRLKRGSRQWNKEQTQIRNLRQKLSNIHDNWEHHTAKAIAENNDVVVVEKLRHTDMRKGTRGTPENPAAGATAKTGLNRSLSHARPGSIHAKLERHAQKSGTHFLKVNPQYTSTTCGKCHHRDKKNRKSQAEFRCLKCDHAVNADHNAAWNILQRGRGIIILYLLLCRYAEAGGDHFGRRSGRPSLDDRPRQSLTPTGAAEPKGVAATGLAPGRHRAHAV